jgi:hypothetical protein
MRRALLIACSQRKTADCRPIPAIRRYDGPAFRVLRRYLLHNHDDELRVWVLSAEFGLIPMDKPILAYDRRMTSGRAAELAPSVARELECAVNLAGPTELFICVGKTYLTALSDWRPSRIAVRLGAPGQGRKLSSLKNWLWEEADRVRR